MSLVSILYDVDVPCVYRQLVSLRRRGRTDRALCVSVFVSSLLRRRCWGGAARLCLYFARQTVSVHSHLVGRRATHTEFCLWIVRFYFTGVVCVCDLGGKGKRA